MNPEHSKSSGLLRWRRRDDLVKFELPSAAANPASIDIPPEIESRLPTWLKASAEDEFDSAPLLRAANDFIKSNRDSDLVREELRDAIESFATTHITPRAALWICQEFDPSNAGLSEDVKSLLQVAALEKLTQLDSIDNEATSEVVAVLTVVFLNLRQEAESLENAERLSQLDMFLAELFAKYVISCAFSEDETLSEEEDVHLRLMGDAKIAFPDFESVLSKFLFFLEEWQKSIPNTRSELLDRLEGESIDPEVLSLVSAMSERRYLQAVHKLAEVILPRSEVEANHWTHPLPNVIDLAKGKPIFALCYPVMNDINVGVSHAYAFQQSLIEKLAIERGSSAWHIGNLSSLLPGLFRQIVNVQKTMSFDELSDAVVEALNISNAMEMHEVVGVLGGDDCLRGGTSVREEIQWLTAVQRILAKHAISINRIPTGETSVQPRSEEIEAVKRILQAANDGRQQTILGWSAVSVSGKLTAEEVGMWEAHSASFVHLVSRPYSDRGDGSNFGLDHALGHAVHSAASKEEVGWGTGQTVSIPLDMDRVERILSAFVPPFSASELRTLQLEHGNIRRDGLGHVPFMRSPEQNKPHLWASSIIVSKREGEDPEERMQAGPRDSESVGSGTSSGTGMLS